MRHVPSPNTKLPDASSSKKALNLISLESLNKEIAEGSTIVVLVTWEITNDSQKQIPFAIISILKEFVDIFLEELLYNISQMPNIQHVIDLYLLFSIYLTTEWIRPSMPNSGGELMNYWLRDSLKKVWVCTLCRHY